MKKEVVYLPIVELKPLEGYSYQGGCFASKYVMTVHREVVVNDGSEDFHVKIQATIKTLSKVAELKVGDRIPCIKKMFFKNTHYESAL